MAGEADDRVREALQRELVPPEHLVGLVGEANRLRHLCPCICAQIREGSDTRGHRFRRVAGAVWANAMTRANIAVVRSVTKLAWGGAPHGPPSVRDKARSV